LSFLPPWVIEKDFAPERQNYMNVVQEKSYVQAGPHANVLSTHSFLKNKFEDGSYRLKSLRVPQGNRDEKIDALRKDCSSAQSSVIRLVLAIAMLHTFTVGSIYVITAYLQSGPLPRRVLYVHLEDGLNQAACGDFCALHTV
jgi:hypothetical protein